ncbi:SUMF1/EgtB/PvdO family nonheme iron enzyme [Candidatus Eisenbacteria bacterium]|uniref:SUMF1/EgtB/PvdO family nonheme iron enzyme n=1 Tax=Eiseniibacteriota bacterium TaxID=2212470 RepID=A0ABV6YL04_UNCEI
MRYLLLVFSVLLGLFTAASADPIPNEMVHVPAGVFVMGDGVAYCGEDEHEVTLTRDFNLGQHEVTNQEYLEAVQWAYDHGYVSEIQFDGAGSFYLQESPSDRAQNAYPGGYDPSEHPVKKVNWYGSVRYCDWLSLQAGLPRAYAHSGDWSCNGGDPYGAQGYRLPTDAEWEYAAQWDDERIYPWGTENPDCSRANYKPSDYCVGWTSPVGSYPDTPQALGLSDMAGNMFEWCNDWRLCYLGTSPVTDPTGPGSGIHRVLHGGSWYWDDHFLRCARRSYEHPSSSATAGFRVARTVPSQAVEQDNMDSAQIFLQPNTPNPFASQTQISYSLPSSSPAVVNVYDATGRMIRTLRNTSYGAGEHSVTWDGQNVAGEAVPAGIYLYELRWNGQSESKRMLLVR